MTIMVQGVTTVLSGSEESDALNAEMQRLKLRISDLEGQLAKAQEKPCRNEPDADPCRSVVENMRGIAFCRQRENGPVRMFGLDAAAMTGVVGTDRIMDREAWVRAIHADDLPGYCTALRRLREQGEGFSLEFRYTHPATGQALWLREQCYVGRDVDGSPCLDGFILDVSAEKVRERQLQDATDSAILADRAKTQFLANVSHELRTPLHAIVGFADLMMTQAFGPHGSPRYLEYSHDIHSSATHLQRLIEEILDFARADAGKDEMRETLLDIGDLTNSALRMVRDHASHIGVSLSVKLDERLPQLRADESKMRQILLNLLSNAIKFTEPGGSVNLTVFERNDGGITLSVVDTGIGIAEEDIPRAFEPFVQLDTGLGRLHQGTGLGLPLSARLAALHDGALTLESEVQKGTVARLILPSSRSIRPRPAGLANSLVSLSATDPGM